MRDKENHDAVDEEVKKALEKMPSIKKLNWDGYGPNDHIDFDTALDIMLANRGLISYWKRNNGYGIGPPGYYGIYELVDWIKNTLREQFIFVTPKAGYDKASHWKIFFWEDSPADMSCLVVDKKPFERSFCDAPPKPTIPDPYYKR